MTKKTTETSSAANSRNKRDAIIALAALTAGFGLAAACSIFTCLPSSHEPNVVDPNFHPTNVTCTAAQSGAALFFSGAAAIAGATACMVKCCSREKPSTTNPLLP